MVKTAFIHSKKDGKALKRLSRPDCFFVKQSLSIIYGYDFFMITNAEYPLICPPFFPDTVLPAPRVPYCQTS